MDIPDCTTCARLSPFCEVPRNCGPFSQTTSELARMWPGFRTFLTRPVPLRGHVRSIFKGVLHGHLGLSDSALEGEIFPKSDEAPILSGLV